MRIQPEDLIVEHEPDDLAALDMAALRGWRERLQSVEYGYSYARRVVQGRLDTLMGELERRRSGAADADLVESMPSTLGTHISGPGLPRPTRDLEPPEWADELVGELDDIMGPADLARLHEVDLEDLADAAERTSALEQELSTARSAMHKRIDRVQAELISRYRNGAGVDDLLG
ncbi:MAG: hypothetical protein M9942_07290 [Microthrixaceae bacterium]|nr:hypothetical protein [Microthrixaceae bacterium]MCO5318228.1 hypothetical protein [Microthrixaceae bacterium]